MKLFSSKKSARRILAFAAVALPLTLAFSFGDDIRQAFNSVADRNVPLEQRQLITHRDPSGDHGAVISAEYISKTGAVPVHAWFSPGNVKIGNISIDWNANDAFTKSIAAMQSCVEGQICNDAQLMALKDKPDWTPADNAAWDSKVAGKIAAVVHTTPGFEKYRTETDGKVPPMRHMNGLSRDIATNGCSVEFDCEGMSVVKSVLQQRMADRFLSPAQKSNIFYASGMVEINRYDEAPGGHAFIVLEKNGYVTGIIEATEDSDVYRVPAKPCSFADFTNGGKIACKDGAGVYGFEFTHAQADAARHAAGMETYDDIQQRIKAGRQKLNLKS